jgi:hypothetical protein
MRRHPPQDVEAMAAYLHLVSSKYPNWCVRRWFRTLLLAGPLTRGFGPLTRGAPRRLEEACTDVQRELAVEKERTATPLLGPLRRFDGADALSGGKLLDEAVPTPASKLHWLLTDAASPMLPQLADTLRWRQLTVPPFHHGHRQVRRHSTASSRVRAAERRR